MFDVGERARIPPPPPARRPDPLLVLPHIHPRRPRARIPPAPLSPPPHPTPQVLYRFADIDPFARSSFFGSSMDLGQFERFRRCFHSRPLAPLLSHAGWEPVAAFDWEGDRGERRAMRRVRVTPAAAPPSAASSSALPLFDLCLVARPGGRTDGVWFTASLTAAAGTEGGGVWPPPT